MPKDHEWKTFSEWARAYGGDCVYFHVLGQPIVVLGSLVAAHDLLNQKVMAGELTGFARGLALMPYSARFQSLRRLIHKELSGNMLQKNLIFFWIPFASTFSLSIHCDAISHNPSYAGSVILRVTYGYQTAPRDDKFLLLAERVMAAFSLASQPGAWAVDIIPWRRSFGKFATAIIDHLFSCLVRHLPSWLPGTKFKQTAAIWAQLNMDVVEGPFNWALAHQSPDVLSEDDQDLPLWAAASLFGGGADTTVAALSSFFLAMALYPEVQAAAQAELDRVLSPGQLPRLSDRPSLPYIECLMREVLRWNPIGPLGPYSGSKNPASITQRRIAPPAHPRRYLQRLSSPCGLNCNGERLVYSTRSSRFSRSSRVSTRALYGMTRQPSKRLVAFFGSGDGLVPGFTFLSASMFTAIATTLSQCKISDPVNLPRRTHWERRRVSDRDN
ncbi:Cytochrome P450 [Mycena venus]|uniref:Cytochrome P450 n=1 Tax=Mycena venus TaxID=2733690 RepID=A0A8H6X7P7_9AGAR|nr:Cytochrome P450 [Mycena venus]